MLHINYSRELWGLPLWVWVAFGAVLLLEYWLPRRRAAGARSILEWLANVLGWMTSRIPGVGPAIARCGSPKPAKPEPMIVTAAKDS